MRRLLIVVSQCVFLIPLSHCTGGSQPSDAAGDARTDSGFAADVADDASIDDATDPPDTDPTMVSRDFTLRVRGMDAFVGHAVGAWVVESTGGHEMGFGRIESLSGPEAEFQLPSLIPEGDYRTDVFVDTNGNGTYDGPSTEPSWSVVIPVHGSATAMLAGTDATTDLGTVMRVPRTDFSAMLAGFTSDEAGHWFELRVIDQSSMGTVGGYVQPHVPASGEIDLTLPGILDDGSSYNVDFWVDMDGNGVYSGPTVDHTWRATLEGTTTLSWTRTDTYTELDWR